MKPLTLLAPPPPRTEADPVALHQRLARWNHRRMAATGPREDWADLLREDMEHQLLEGAFIESGRAAIADVMASVPTEPKAFIEWFEGLKATGPGQHDPLFDWLAEDATLDEICWFLTQEAAGEAGFEDLVAMTQVKLPDAPKLELARNYWDEMGRGNLGGMHGPMLNRTVEILGLKPSIETTVWQSLALANTMTAFAATRRYAWHSVGALGVVELTAPDRVARVAAGLKRHAVEPKARKYFDLHAILDVKHSEDWNREALLPAVTEDPQRCLWLAEGALMRLTCGAACFDAYRAHLWAEDRKRA